MVEYNSIIRIGLFVAILVATAIFGAWYDDFMGVSVEGTRIGKIAHSLRLMAQGVLIMYAMKALGLFLIIPGD